MIKEGAKRTLQNLNAAKPYVPSRPTTIPIGLSTVDKADEFRGRHGVEIIEPHKVVSRGEDWMQAWNQVGQC